MIKAAIFDCFGVLVGSSYNLFYETHLSGKPELIAQMKALDHASNKGNITHDDFYKGVASLTNMPELEIRDFMRQTPPNLELLEYIKNNLKPSYKIGFLSNVASNMMDDLFSKQQQSLFDDIVLSFEVGMAKPQTEIFELAAKRLRVSTDECIFIDDLKTYLDAADIVGMKTVLYEDFPSFKQKFEMELL